MINETQSRSWKATVLLVIVVVLIGAIATAWKEHKLPSDIPKAQKSGGSFTCKPGFYPSSRNSEGTTCTACPVGNSCAGGFAGAEPCPIGTFQPRTKASACVVAKEGHFVSQQGQSRQQQCDYGHYAARPGCGECKQAQPGHFVNKLGARAQTPCPSGTYQPKFGQTECIQYATDEKSKSPKEENDRCSATLFSAVKNIGIQEVGFIHNEAINLVRKRMTAVEAKINKQKLLDTGVIDQLSRDEAIRFLTKRLCAPRCLVSGFYDLIGSGDGEIYATQMERQFIQRVQVVIDNSRTDLEIRRGIERLERKYAGEVKGLVLDRIRLAGSVGKKSAQLWFDVEQKEPFAKKGKWKDIIKADLEGAAIGAGIGSTIGGPVGAGIGAAVGGIANSIAAAKDEAKI